ncbi:hypothetical protein SmJEL517_g01929 [Synchytrium microbalum]|uniref:Protein kinase domain-containing protein n=1 Tax=Synchytrium microbalum TaxID=1806994 RepID=A0A507CCB5_9FUNG|nr:uncharacterized protein SmJEL517_g01929 [Synchytrium microbalum]TPX35666.1 hypothetical protein SmJEL517_g01929 [Synchytrium microbalum]
MTTFVPFPTLPSDLYTLVSKLGSGSSGNVYLAKLNPTKNKAFKPARRPEQVAVKVVLRSGLKVKGAEAGERILQEVSILKRLSHPHIVKFVDVEWDTQHILILTEYCDLGNLQEYLNRKRNKRLPESDAKVLFRQLVAGLHFLWTNGLVHRDLKPANLLLSGSPASPTLKIADFGISQFEDASNGVMTDKIGTLYMAPEVFTGIYDSRCDLWSIGCIYYEMLSGTPPFGHATSKDAIISHLKSPTPECIALPPSIESNTSPQASEMIRRLLTRNPASRITFRELFESTYLDLEHLPSPESLGVGVEMAAEALALDNQVFASDAASKAQVKDVEQIDRVVWLYAEAVAHLLAHVQWVGNSSKGGEGVKKRIVEYIQRAEALKEEAQLMRNSGGGAVRSEVDNKRNWTQWNRPSQRSSNSIPPSTPLSSTTTPSALSSQGRIVLAQAQELVDSGLPASALPLFDEGLGFMIRALQQTGNGSEKEKLRGQVDYWFDVAERVKEVVHGGSASNGGSRRVGSAGKKDSLINIHYRASVVDGGESLDEHSGGGSTSKDGCLTM